MSNILLNVACSFTSSLIFIYFILWLYRPRIEIANLIAQRVDDFDRRGETYYSFKIRNKSLFKAFDINVQLYEVVYFPADDGKKNTRHIALTLKTNKFNYIGRSKSRWIYSTYCENSLVFRSYEDLTNIFEDASKALQLEVTLRHGLTGISAIYMKEFINGSIKQGKFKAGREIAVIPESKSRLTHK